MQEEIEVLKQHVESLSLDQKASVTEEDKVKLIQHLKDADELGLANYVSQMKDAKELSEFIEGLYI